MNTLIVSELEGANPKSKAQLARDYSIEPPAINYYWKNRVSVKAEFSANPEASTIVKSSKSPINLRK